MATSQLIYLYLFLKNPISTHAYGYDNLFFRIQNMKYVNGVAEYSGALDVMSKVVRNEGFFALWKGET